VELVKIKTSAVAITVDDPELITSDKQRIGLQVTADVFRPHEKDLVTSNYARYRGIYTDDGSLQQRMTAFTLQAMKVCVGDKKSDEAVISSGRDALRACIDDELSGLAELYAAHPDYVSLQIALANAQAIKETDQLIFTPDGVFPNLIFNGGAIPSFDVNAQP